MSKIFEHVKAITESAARLELDSVDTTVSCITVLGHAAISTGATDREILDAIANQLMRIRQERNLITAERCTTEQK